MMIVVFFALLFAIGSAAAGKDKGMGGTGFILGLLLGPIGLVIVLASNGDRKACPSCRENVRSGALKCRFCGFDFPAPPPVPVIECPKCHHRYGSDLTGCDFCGMAKPKTVAAAAM